LLPQFIDWPAGNIVGQTVTRGATRIAGTIRLLAGRPSGALVQRWLMGTVLAGLALHMAMDSGPLSIPWDQKACAASPLAGAAGIRLLTFAHDPGSRGCGRRSSRNRDRARSWPLARTINICCPRG
jgi:hypothetical protein